MAGSLHRVAKTGAYDDLGNCPSSTAYATSAQGALAQSALQSFTESDPVAGAALVTHAALTTTAHGGIVGSSDSRLSNSRTPTAHKSTHATGGADALAPSDIGAATAAQGTLAASALQSQVNADWNASSGAAQVLNKPTIPSGTVTSVALSVPAGFGVGGTPITGSGTLSFTKSRTFSNAPSRSVSTTNNSANGFQLSASQDAHVSYPVTISTTATIGGAGAGTMVLEICSTNSATGANWTTIDTFTNSQTITLAVALSSVQAMTGSVRGYVPAGYYARIRSLAATGTVTYSTTVAAGQEVLL